MGIIYSLLGWTSAEEEPDPVLGLTPRQIKLVKESWTVATKDRTKLGSGIMTSVIRIGICQINPASIQDGFNNESLFDRRLFDKYPEYKQLFPFRDVPDEELKGNMKFKVHCSTVVYSLGQIVDNLDSSELVVAMLDKLASNHIKHNSPPEGFLKIKSIIEDALRPITNDEVFQAWSKLLTVAMTYASNKMLEEKKI